MTTTRLLPVLTAASIILCSAIMAKAQIPGKTPPINVRDLDQEARNAYQESCNILSSSNPQAVCSFPALPAGKRLAIRWFSAYCRQDGSRVLGIELKHAIADNVTPLRFEHTFFRGLQSINRGDHTLSSPVYAHADTAPTIEATINTDQHGTTICEFSLRGYLVDRE